ncbi:MAG: hypothetical protein AB9846_10035 [Tenuifilaceae bacterium]
MIRNSTPYIFQYTFLSGIEHSSLVDANYFFDQHEWIQSKINEAIAKCPNLPDVIIERILEKSKIH